MRQLKLVLSLPLLLLLSVTANATSGKLIATPGVTQVEGAAGGGLVPWAVTAGYDTRDEVSLSAFTTRVDVDDYALQVFGMAYGYKDRVELSIARQRFQLERLGGSIRQNVFGAKLRVYGDLIYSRWPQVSVGAQYKRLLDQEVARLVGASETNSGADYYIAISKLHLGAIAGYNALWSTSLRSSKANQLGLLGFGSGADNDRDWLLEGSAAILFSRHLAVGIEYREKSNRLGLGEDDWADIFLAYFPNKKWNVTAAWVELGSIAGAKEQNGLYLSITGYLH